MYVEWLVSQQSKPFRVKIISYHASTCSLRRYYAHNRDGSLHANKHIMNV